MLLKHATTAGQRRSSSQLTAEEDDGGAEVRKPTKFEICTSLARRPPMLPMTPSTKTVLEGNSSGMGWIPPPRHLEDFVLYNASKAMRGATTRQQGVSWPAGSIRTVPRAYALRSRALSARRAQYTYSEDDELRRRQTRSPPPAEGHRAAHALPGAHVH